MLHKHARPFCVLLSPDLGCVTLPHAFIKDLYHLFSDRSRYERLSHDRIAVDLFRGVVARETVTRACLGDFDQAFFPSISYALIASILLREIIPFSMPVRYRHSDCLSPSDRQLVLELLYAYGVQCADGSCCGLTRGPIPAPAVAA